MEQPLCAVVDPVRDFRWHALRCGGPETAAFLCELPGKTLELVNPELNLPAIMSCNVCFVSSHPRSSNVGGGLYRHVNSITDCAVYVGQWYRAAVTGLWRIRHETHLLPGETGPGQHYRATAV